MSTKKRLKRTKPEIAEKEKEEQELKLKQQKTEEERKKLEKVT